MTTDVEIQAEALLGHVSAAMTLDVYSDLFDDELEAVARAMSTARKAAVSKKLWAKRGHQQKAPVDHSR